MRHGRLFFRLNYPENSHTCLLFVPEVEKNSTEMAFWSASVCARLAHMELFLHTLRFLQPIFTYHIDPMCVPFTLHVPLVRQWNNSQRKTPWKIPPCPEVVPVFPPLRSGQWTYPPPLILTLPFSPKPTHTDPAHLIYSHLLMSNSCRVDSQRIAAITSSPPSLLFFSAILCVAPNIRSLISPNVVS